MDTEETKPCPYCDSPMAAVHFIIGGGVWYCESKEFLDLHCSDFSALDDADKRRMRTLNKQHPLHCIIGGSGFHDLNATWPKSGLYCNSCGTFTIKTNPY